MPALIHAAVSAKAAFQSGGVFHYLADDGVAQRIRDAGIAVSPTIIAALRTARRFRASGARHNPLDVSAIERLEGRLTNVGHFRRLESISSIEIL